MADPRFDPPREASRRADDPDACHAERLLPRDGPASPGRPSVAPGRPVTMVWTLTRALLRRKQPPGPLLECRRTIIQPTRFNTTWLLPKGPNNTGELKSKRAES